MIWGLLHPIPSYIALVSKSYYHLNYMRKRVTKRCFFFNLSQTHTTQCKTYQWFPPFFKVIVAPLFVNRKSWNTFQDTKNWVTERNERPRNKNMWSRFLQRQYQTIVSLVFIQSNTRQIIVISSFSWLSLKNERHHWRYNHSLEKELQEPQLLCYWVIDFA